MAGAVATDDSVASTTGMGDEDCSVSGDSLSEWRSCEQVANGSPSTSPPFWDTDDEDDPDIKKPAGTAKEIESYFGCSASNLVLVGDRYFTDVVYGNRNGFFTCSQFLLTQFPDVNLHSMRWPKLFWISACAPLASVIISTLLVFLFKAQNHGISIGYGR